MAATAVSRPRDPGRAGRPGRARLRGAGAYG
jgi:hypothetical protein